MCPAIFWCILVYVCPRGNAARRALPAGILLCTAMYMCPPIFWCILVYVCPRGNAARRALPAGVLVYTAVDMLYMCPAKFWCILVYVCPRGNAARRALCAGPDAASYGYICVLILPCILLHMCPHTASYCYICVRVATLLDERFLQFSAAALRTGAVSTDDADEKLRNRAISNPNHQDAMTAGLFTAPVLSEGGQLSSEVVLRLLMGRELRVVKARHGIAIFDFEELCGRYLSYALCLMPYVFCLLRASTQVCALCLIPYPLSLTTIQPPLCAKSQPLVGRTQVFLFYVKVAFFPVFFFRVAISDFEEV